MNNTITKSQEWRAKKKSEGYRSVQLWIPKQMHNELRAWIYHYKLTHPEYYLKQEVQ